MFFLLKDEVYFVINFLKLIKIAEVYLHLLLSYIFLGIFNAVSLLVAPPLALQLTVKYYTDH